MKLFLKTSSGIIAAKISILFLLYTLIRIIFIFFNHDLFEMSSSEFVKIIFVGLRFDIMTLVLVNFPWILASTLPFSFSYQTFYLKFWNIYFVVFNALALMASLIDVVFYRFNMKRMNTEVFGLIGVVPSLMTTFLKDFWYLFIAIALVIYLLIKLSLFKPTQFSKSYDRIAFILLFPLLVLGFRGGWQRKPLRPLTSAEFVSINHTPLVLNSAFTLIKSLDNRTLTMKRYFSDNELDNLYSGTHYFPNAEPQVKNIVIIILESFSKEFIQTYNPKNNATPFLDSLIKKSTSFKNSFANGRRSSEGLVSILAGLPNLMDDPYLHSNYADTSFKGLGQNLKELSYHTYFFNGSFKATLGWVDFILASGIDQHLSRESYNNEKHSDGNWGIYDDYMLDYFGSFKFKEPFLGIFFSLSSHHPYKVRDELPFKKFKNDFLNSVSYTDHSLKLFFEKYKNESWFKNSLFIITADHSPGAHSRKTDKAHSNPFKNSVGLYKVPLLIYNPQDETGIELNQAVQHVDVMPTILKLAGYKKPFYSFGEDLFTKKSPYVYQYSNGIYQILDDTFVLFFDGEKSVSFFNYQNDIDLKDNLIGNEMLQDKIKVMEDQMKAYIQRFHRDLMKNELRPKS